MANDVAIKDLYQIIISTRNLEINLFWQRSNYFLALNTAIAFGFFNLREAKYLWTFAALGLISSMLWLWVCLGSKYWQTRWEQRLIDFETENVDGNLAFFAARPDRIEKDVTKGFQFNRSSSGPIQRLLYDLALRRKPSVSYSMIRLAIVFILGWAALIVFLSCFGSPLSSPAAAG